MVFWLADQNVEFIEQPFPALNLEDTKVRSISPLPLLADENSVTSNDLNSLRKFLMA